MICNTVTLGVYHLLATGEHNHPHEIYNVERVYIHDSFAIQNYRNDIALLRLQKVSFTSHKSNRYVFY